MMMNKHFSKDQKQPAKGIRGVFLMKYSSKMPQNFTYFRSNKTKKGCLLHQNPTMLEIIGF